MRRLLILLPACGLVLLTAGCGGDDGDAGGSDDNQPSNMTAGTDPKDEKKLVARTADCDAEVRAKGASDWEWSGHATVRTGGRSVDEPGPRAVYRLTHKPHRVALFSPGPEFEGSVSLSVGDTSYSSDPADAASLEIDPHGTEADVDLTVTSTGGDKIELDAEFTCGRTKED